MSSFELPPTGALSFCDRQGSRPDLDGPPSTPTGSGSPRGRQQEGSAGIVADLSAVEIARAVMQEHFAGGLHIAVRHGEYLAFKGTHWCAILNDELRHLAMQEVTKRPRPKGIRATTLIRDAAEIIKIEAAGSNARLDFDASPEPVFNCLNGVVWVRAGGSVDFTPHSPAYPLRSCLKVAYDPKAVCPRYDAAMAEIFSCSISPLAMASYWHELTGYVLQPVRLIEAVVVGSGEGGNGKSALVQTWMNMLGRDLVSAMPVEDWNRTRFTLGDLEGKRMCLDDDVDARAVLPDGLLKTLSKATPLTGERKHLRARTFTAGVVPVLLCNNVPELNDSSAGMRRRLHVVPFDRRFDDAELDRSLFPTIWTEEMPGVLNRAIEGLQRVVRRRWKFDPPEAVKRATDEWFKLATRRPSGDPSWPKGAGKEAAALIRPEAQVPGLVPVPDTPVAKVATGSSRNGKAHVTLNIGPVRVDIAVDG